MRSLFKHLIVFILAFGLAGAGAFYFIRIFTKSADELVLPNLTGKNIIYVLETLTNMGLNTKLDSTLYDDLIPRYTVISQEPAPGTTIKKGRDVVIYLSRGKKENLMPDLRLISFEHARILLETNQFKTGHLSYTYSSDVPKGKIIAQYPEPFSISVKDIFCNLLISQGKRPESRAMPDLKNQMIETASSIMNTNHLAISKILSDTHPGKEQGVVLSQDPEAGSMVNDTTRIILTVNALQKNQTMPPDMLNRIVMLTHLLGPGFLKSHVRVQTDMFGPCVDLYDEYMKPGDLIQILIPTINTTNISLFIDHKLVKTLNFNPWNKDNTTGEMLWESSPLQFYQPILQN
ncbi:MAG: PASTA domain-containing protein [Pseudomonadota bacterium]